jgi:hypothetical protein
MIERRKITLEMTQTLITWTHISPSRCPYPSDRTLIMAQICTSGHRCHFREKSSKKKIFKNLISFVLNVAWENIKIRLRKVTWGLALVTHTYNHSYWGGRDQEDPNSKPACVKSLWDPISKNPSQEEGSWSGSGYKPWVQTPVLQKINK